MTTLTIKNKQTGKAETIAQHDLSTSDWGFSFFTDGEMEAYKAAYSYRNCEHGTKVEFAGGVKRWMVTVFNDVGAAIGLDGSR